MSNEILNERAVPLQPDGEWEISHLAP